MPDLTAIELRSLGWCLLIVGGALVVLGIGAFVRDDDPPSSCDCEFCQPPEVDR